MLGKSKGAHIQSSYCAHELSHDDIIEGLVNNVKLLYIQSYSFFSTTQYGFGIVPANA